ncbi:hypothetical protein [Clostridium botulinum]|uniref:Putative lipoprotein n=1 Tax=Clostridium botulinum (strain Langeland / NCTC 10281 / Type F) TaxID=441772 RepID=A7GAZ3_CLOBL|nr:hypothetical protein [Clostridium botulinum]ABS42490.1 putative lipoprotein [Clostridium botulinum F str. Langeland]ADF98415.1 putative lipoprotein [Clostridium botulinum F str. 230613]KKM40294.1 hypothetical protein VT72_18570 [Clostridium botulinum]MBY6793417.1 hypothetical protein [Clostridium botulinum]MBY6939017.1 hypothetical protein [Clostridium botulinum]
MRFKKTFIYVFLMIMSLSITSCSFVEPINSIKSIKEIQATTPIPKDYLDNIVKKYVGPEGMQPYFGGKTFYDYKIIDSEKSGDIIKIYLDLIGQEYYIEDDKLAMGTGGAFFASVTMKKENNNYKLVSYKVSKELETEESLKIFPKSIRKKALRTNTPSLKNVEKEAETYFKKTKN